MKKFTKNILLPTSTAGSLPKPSWLAEPETLWSPWKLQGDELTEGKKDALCLALQDQQLAGIDIVSDGEQTRQHFVTTFIEHLNGVDFEKRKTVKIRDRYDASVPTVVGPVSRQKPVFVEDATFLRQQTKQPIKWALPGPMTMIDTLYDDHYKSRKELAWEFAKILNQEAKELEAAGVDIIQFDEPAFNVFFDEVNDWGIDCLERAIEGLKCETAVHICYGYGIKANTDWKMNDLIGQRIQEIKSQVQDNKVLLGLSGGVDSSVTAALLHEAIGNKLVCVFVLLTWGQEIFSYVRSILK